MSEVYFLRLDRPTAKTLTEAGNKISATFFNFFSLDDKVAIKVHFGERGSQTYLSPIFVKAIYDNLKDKVKEAVLSDCTVLYKSERSFGSLHKKLAKAHGFNFAPILIADGERGNEEVEIEVNQKHFQKVKLGAGIKNFNTILAISHFKGHGMAGFGAALKNVGMGFGSKSGKLEMHKAFNRKINPDLCQGCQLCQKECPAKAIFMENGRAKINYQKCIGCGYCVSICPAGAVEIPWADSSSEELQERIVEYAYGALKNKKSFFINVLINITPRCDCVAGIQGKIVKDIGILVSKDIVAVDQTSLDLAGIDNFKKRGVDPSIQINYAQKMGLGSKKYKLIKI